MMLRLVSRASSRGGCHLLRPSPLKKVLTLSSVNQQKTMSAALQRGRGCSTSTSTSTAATSSSKAAHSEAAAVELPPRLLRIGLVGMTTAVFTPMYATLGVMRMSRMLFRNGGIEGAIAVTIVGGMLFVIGVSCKEDIYSFIFYHSNLLLPFAISNGVVASATYAIVERHLIASTATEGKSLVDIGSTLLSGKGLGSIVDIFKSNRMVIILPAAIGGATALISPLLWSTAIQLCWSKDEIEFYLSNDKNWPSKFYRENIMFPLGIPIGVFTGLSLGLVLEKIVVRPCNWRASTLPAFLAVSAAGAVYFGFFQDRILGYWEVRSDAKTGALKSYNAKTGETLRDNGSLGTRVEGYKAFSAISQQGLVGFIEGKVRLLLWGTAAKKGKGAYVKIDVDNRQDMSMVVMAERAKVTRSLDVMLQYKHLLLTTRAGRESLRERDRKNELQIMAKMDQIDNLEYLLCSFENLIIAQKRGDSAAANRYYRQIENAVGRTDLVILADNAPFVERELARELGYSLTASTPYWKSSILPSMNRRLMTQVLEAAAAVVCLAGTLALGSRFF